VNWARPAVEPYRMSNGSACKIHDLVHRQRGDPAELVPSDAGGGMGCGGGAGAGVAIRLTNGQIHIFVLPFGIFQQSFRKIPCAMHDAFDSQRITFHIKE
jgi:hypothetical protein